MAVPLFPSLTPRFVDPLWFIVDKPCTTDETDISRLEAEHRNWVTFSELLV